MQARFKKVALIATPVLFVVGHFLLLSQALSEKEINLQCIIALGLDWPSFIFAIPIATLVPDEASFYAGFIITGLQWIFFGSLVSLIATSSQSARRWMKVVISIWLIGAIAVMIAALLFLRANRV